MSDVCSAKEEWVENGAEGHEIRDDNDLQVGFRLGEKGRPQDI